VTTEETLLALAARWRRYAEGQPAGRAHLDGRRKQAAQCAADLEAALAEKTSRK
jgi:hypothetical protein